jgi:hypothetical protein
MSPCMLCRQDRKLIKAHAIPEAFFREVRVGSAAPILVSANEGQFPRKAPIGVYDEGILCEVCEPIFGPINDYGIAVILKDFSSQFRQLTRDGRIGGYESNTADRNQILQFLVAVLWRASVSTHDFYSNVNLGPHEALARTALSSSEVELHSVFDAVLSRWKDPDKVVPPTVILDPRRERWSGVNGYRLYLGENVAFVKVDAQPFPTELRIGSLRSPPPLLVVARSMANSKDLHVMKQTALRSHKNASNFAGRGRHPNGAA